MKRDFFLSFNKADRDWATWIVWTLEEAGYTVYFQDSDFEPGSNFVLEMHKAVQNSQCVILVLSDSFLSSGFTSAEWAAKFAEDPTGANRALLPIRVRDCKPQGLLGAIVFVDLVSLAEDRARETLLAAAARRVSRRGKPAAFPGASPVPPANQGAAASVYPPAQPQFQAGAAPKLWLYVATPKDMSKVDVAAICDSLESAGDINLLLSQRSGNLEMADIAIFIVGQDPTEAWLKRFDADLYTAWQKKIPWRIYSPAEFPVAVSDLVKRGKSYPALVANPDVSEYRDLEDLKQLLRVDTTQVRSGLQIAEQSDWYLSADHRGVLMEMRKGDYERALALSEKLLASRPYSPRGRYNLACILSNLADDAPPKKRAELLDAAQEALAKAVSYGLIRFMENAFVGGPLTRKAAISKILHDPDLETLFMYRADLRLRLQADDPTKLFAKAQPVSMRYSGKEPPRGSPGCIEASMPVDTPDGRVTALGMLKEKSKVVSWNKDGRSAEVGKVGAVATYMVSDLVIVNGCLRVTPLHPLLTTAGWRRAGDLIPGDLLVCANGTYSVVESKIFASGRFVVCELGVRPSKNLSVRGVIAHNDKY